MTEKLYEQDSMLKSCLATVLSCAEDKRGYAVVLDRTVFFPEGGGSQHFAQGGGAYSDDWRQKVLQLQQLLKE